MQTTVSIIVEDFELRHMQIPNHISLFLSLSLCFETFFFLFGLVWFFNILYEQSRWQLLFCDRRLEAQIDMQHILILKRREKKCTTIKRSGSNNNEAFVKCVRFLHVNGLEMD